MLLGRISGLAALGALVVVAAALVAGCGGGEDTADAGVTITKTEFIKQGDAICEDLERRREKQAGEVAEENDFIYATATKKQMENLITEIAIPTLRQQAEELDALGAPEGDEEQVEKIIVSLQSETAEYEDNPGLALKTGDPLEGSDELAKAYGFKVCFE